MGEANPASFPAKFGFCKADELIKRTSYLRYRNWQGFNIYCRPNSTQYVLVDDIRREKLFAVAQHKPCVLLETSPDNFQAFFRLHEQPKDLTEAKAICQELASLFDGDQNAANPMQVGRLPGFTNRKPKYADFRGNYPYVILRGAADRFSMFSPKGGACLNGTSTYGAVPQQQLRVKTQGGVVDRSREDFRIACRMIQAGHSHEDVYQVLAEREKGKERGRSYINFTIKNACRTTENR